MQRFERFYYLECQKQWLYDSQLDDVIPALLATCGSFGVSPCDEPFCVQNREMLDEFVPQTKYFRCLREWVMQAVACNMQVVASNKPPGPLVPQQVRVREPGSGWDNEPQPLMEVLSLLSWFGGFFGSYQAISPPPPLRLVAKRDASLLEAYGVERMENDIVNALMRLEKYNVCPRRAWVAVSTLPGGELNLPALIPDSDCPVIPYLDHDRWNEDREHALCTVDHCKNADIDSTHIKQLHVCRRSSNCRLTENHMFPNQKLFDAIKRKQLTAWSLDGLSIFGGDAFNRDFSSTKEQFIAISHVWADGTGAGDPKEMGGHVRKCLFNMFCDIARELRCKGVWWDAICIPGKDFEHQRHASLEFMERNYSAAKYTVVHDLYLRRMPWIDAESACLALVLSPWFTRGWTALEFSRSDQIFVIFAKTDDPSDGHVLKNLDRDILLPGRVGGSACQLVTRAIIQALRKETRGYRSAWSPGISYMKLQVNDLLISLKGRSTSWPRDKPTIACLLAEVELPTVETNPSRNPPPDPKFCRMVLQGRGIRAQNLFHEAEAAKDFGWQPASLLDLPVSTGDYSAKLRISPAPPKINFGSSSTRGRSDVVGSWSFICEPSRDPDLRAFRNVTFEWPEPGEDEEANEARERIRHAITDAVRSPRHHIILVDTNQRYPSRGILVKVREWRTGTMRPNNVKEIFGERGFSNLREQTSFPCEFVGVVRFSSCELPIMSAVTFVLFGTDYENLAKDLHPQISAWSFINSNVQGLDSRKYIFDVGRNNVGTWSGERPEEDIWEEVDPTSISGRTSGRKDVRKLLIPRMRLAGLSSNAGDLALSGCDRIQLSHPHGLLIGTTDSEMYTN
jgi:hypothetical protein